MTFTLPHVSPVLSACFTWCLSESGSHIGTATKIYRRRERLRIEERCSTLWYTTSLIGWCGGTDRSSSSGEGEGSGKHHPLQQQFNYRVLIQPTPTSFASL